MLKLLTSFVAGRIHRIDKYLLKYINGSKFTGAELIPYVECKSVEIGGKIFKKIKQYSKWEFLPQLIIILVLFFIYCYSDDYPGYLKKILLVYKFLYFERLLSEEKSES